MKFGRIQIPKDTAKLYAKIFFSPLKKLYTKISYMYANLRDK